MIKGVMQLVEFLPREKAGDLLARVGPDRPRRTGNHVPAGDRVIEDVPKNPQAMVGVVRRGPAVIIEPPHHRG